MSVCYAPDATSLHLSLLYLPFSPSRFLPLFPSECPPATATSGFGSVLEEGSPSKLSRRAQHNEERYFVKRRRRYGVNDRMDERTGMDGLRGKIPRTFTRIKKICDAAHGNSALQTLPSLWPSPPCVTFRSFCRARVPSLSFSRAFCA